MERIIFLLRWTLRAIGITIELHMRTIIQFRMNPPIKRCWLKAIMLYMSSTNFDC